MKLDVPLLKQPLHFMPDQSVAPAWMTQTLAKIKEASGFVIVSAEYNCTIPPALTNLLDHFPLSAYRHKPVSIVTYSKGNLKYIGISCSSIHQLTNSQLFLLKYLFIYCFFGLKSS